jgi:hypothetical protein
VYKQGLNTKIGKQVASKKNSAILEMMTTLEKRLLQIRPVVYARVEREDQSYVDAISITVEELTRLVKLYHNNDNLMQLRLIRDSIDHWIRRYHAYSIRGSIGSHYLAKGVDSKNSIFEHVIPAKYLRDYLLSGSITAEEALNAPTCQISKEQDKVLRNNGLTSTNNNLWYFFRRYDVLNTEFTMHCGQSIIDYRNCTLADHYKKFVAGYN